MPPLDLPPLAGPAPSLSRQERERRERRAWIVALCPRFAAALSRGSLTTGHIDILASVLQGVCESVRERVLDQEDDLLTAALAGSPEFLARAVRRAIDRVVESDGIDRAAQQRANSKLREWDDAATGMHHVHLELDPELALRFTASLGAEVEAMFHGGAAKGLSPDRVAALALVNLMAASQGGTRRSNPDRVQFLVVCDFDTLFAGLHDRSILETAGGTAIHLETARRLWCDGEITSAITIDGKVESLISGDELANRALRRALRSMYRTCVHPGCAVVFDRCHIHHVRFRHLGGKTELPNLVPVCYRHHHLVHEGRWRLSIDADRTLHWYEPDGTLHARCPLVPLADLDRVPRPPPAPVADGAHAPPRPTSPPMSSGPGELRLFDTDASAA